MVYKYNSAVVVAAHPVRIAASCLCTFVSLSVQRGCPQKSARLCLCACIHGRYGILSPSCEPWIINPIRLVEERAHIHSRACHIHLEEPSEEIFSGLEYLIHGSVFPGKPLKATFRRVPWKNNKDVLLYASCQIASSLTIEHRLALY